MRLPAVTALNDDTKINDHFYCTKKRFALFVIVTTALSMTVCMGTGCKESKGGFGEGEVKDKSGMVHKPLKEAPKPPDFAKAFALTSSFDKSKSEVKLQLKLKKGFHAYAKGETIGKPVELLVDVKSGWTVDGTPVIPLGKKKDLGELGESFILEGVVPITAKVQGGQGPVSGKLMVQVCTDTACDRPRPHVFTVATN